MLKLNSSSRRNSFSSRPQKEPNPIKDFRNDSSHDSIGAEDISFEDESNKVVDYTSKIINNSFKTDFRKRKLVKDKFLESKKNCGSMSGWMHLYKNIFHKNINKNNGSTATLNEIGLRIRYITCREDFISRNLNSELEIEKQNLIPNLLALYNNFDEDQFNTNGSYEMNTVFTTFKNRLGFSRMGTKIEKRSKPWRVLVSIDEEKNREDSNMDASKLDINETTKKLIHIKNLINSTAEKTNNTKLKLTNYEFPITENSNRSSNSNIHIVNNSNSNSCLNSPTNNYNINLTAKDNITNSFKRKLSRQATRIKKESGSIPELIISPMTSNDNIKLNTGNIFANLGSNGSIPFTRAGSRNITHTKQGKKKTKLLDQHLFALDNSTKIKGYLTEGKF